MKGAGWVEVGRKCGFSDEKVWEKGEEKVTTKVKRAQASSAKTIRVCKDDKSKALPGRHMSIAIFPFITARWPLLYSNC